MTQPRSLLMVLGLALALTAQMGFAQASTEAEPAASAADAAAEDAAAEAKAREYFTDLEVIDQDGNRLRFYSDVLEDRVVLINFIFTNCPGACPLMTQKLIQTRQQMAEVIKDEVWFVSISVDPERDTPEAMKAFAAKQGADEHRWLFLTGKKENLEHIVRKLGQYTPDVDSHSTLMLAANTRVRHWTRVMPMVPPAGIAEQMRALWEEAPG